MRRELSREFTAALLGIRADEEGRERYDELADKNTEGTPTDAERAVLALLVQANALLGVLKAEAHTRLEAAGG